MIRVSHQKGFSLIEALVGLTLVGVAMLLSLSLLAQQPGVERRIAAHQEVLRLMEMEFELLRSGGGLPVIPDSEDGLKFELDISDLPRVSPPVSDNLRMWIKTDIVGVLRWRLYEVELTTTYLVREKPFDLTLKTMIFKPSS